MLCAWEFKRKLGFLSRWLYVCFVHVPSLCLSPHLLFFFLPPPFSYLAPLLLSSYLLPLPSPSLEWVWAPSHLFYTVSFLIWRHNYLYLIIYYLITGYALYCRKSQIHENCHRLTVWSHLVYQPTYLDSTREELSEKILHDTFMTSKWGITPGNLIFRVVNHTEVIEMEWLELKVWRIPDLICWWWPRG